MKSLFEKLPTLLVGLFKYTATKSILNTFSMLTDTKSNKLLIKSYRLHEIVTIEHIG